MLHCVMPHIIKNAYFETINIGKGDNILTYEKKSARNRNGCEPVGWLVRNLSAGINIPRYLLATSIVLKVEQASSIDAHHWLTAGYDINAERIQMQVNHMRTQSKSYLMSCLLYQSEAVKYRQL